MRLHILRARTDVKPLAFVQDNAANFPPFLDPIEQDGNKRYFSLRNALKNFSAPDRNIRKIVIAGDAESFANVDDTSVSKCNRRLKSRLAQGKGDIVPSTEMLLNERGQRNVR